MDEEQLRRIIREELASQLGQIRLHLLAISQATGAVPWSFEYKFATNEDTENFPFSVLFDHRAEKQDPEKQA